MQPELLTPEYDESEQEEKAVRRSNLIRMKYGSLANFLLQVAKDASSSELCAVGSVREPERNK